MFEKITAYKLTADKKKANTAMVTRSNAPNGIFCNIRAELLICLLLVMVTFAVYWQVRNYAFVYIDDSQYVTENQHVQAGLSIESIIWVFSSYHAANWHPITWLSHMLDVALYGLNPGAHHQTNVIFHLFNALLLFFVLRKMTGGLWQSGFVAALFALHPLHVESVAWVSERKDVLSTFFWMLTMFSYARYAAHPGIKRYLPVVGFFILGLMAKPMLVTLPFVLLLLDYWPLRRMQFNPPGDGDIRFIKKRSPGLFLVWEKIPLFLLALASSVVTYMVQKMGGAVGSMEIYPFTVRVANALVSYVKYLGKMIWPAHLAVFYPHAGMLPLWQVVGAGVLLGLITIAAIRSFRQRPWFIVGWLWFLGTLVPVIGLVQVGLQAMADRYTYIPLIGVFIIVAWGVPELLHKWRHKEKLLGIATVAVLAVLSITSWAQIQYWKNTVLLFNHTIEVTDDNYVMHNNLGFALTARGRPDEAIKHYKEALRLNPGYEPSNINLGLALLSQGKFDECIDYYQEVLRVNPGYAGVHNNLGAVLWRLGKIEEATVHFQKAVLLKPDYAEAHNSLGAALVYRGNNEKAIAHLQEALRLKPDYSLAQRNLRKALAPGKHINDVDMEVPDALK